MLFILILFTGDSFLLFVDFDFLVLFVCLFSQEKDLKQYMDDCGGIMSMNNVRVRANKIFVSIIFSENVGALLILTR